MSKEMTNEEIGGLIDDLVSTIHQWYAEAAEIDGIQSLSSVVAKKLEPLFTGLTAPEKEEPQEGEYGIISSAKTSFLRISQGEHRFPIIATFDDFATPATRRMMKKAKESYEQDKKFLKQLKHGGFVFQNGSPEHKSIKQRVNYIQTGEKG